MLLFMVLGGGDDLHFENSFNYNHFHTPKSTLSSVNHLTLTCAWFIGLTWGPESNLVLSQSIEEYTGEVTSFSCKLLKHKSKENKTLHSISNSFSGYTGFGSKAASTIFVGIKENESPLTAMWTSQLAAPPQGLFAASSESCEALSDLACLVLSGIVL